jgi:hypothetical protein
MKFQAAIFPALAALAGSINPANAQSATSSACTTPASSFVPPALNLTAISASNGNSTLECWALPGFVASAQAGTVGALNLFLGDLANATYTVIPPRFNGGLHKAPAPQSVPRNPRKSLNLLQQHFFCRPLFSTSVVLTPMR